MITIQISDTTNGLVSMVLAWAGSIEPRTNGY